LILFLIDYQLSNFKPNSENANLTHEKWQWQKSIATAIGLQIQSRIAHNLVIP